MKIRAQKIDDQQKCEQAYQYLLELIHRHEHEIEPALWVGAMIGALSENYEKSDIPYKYFKSEIYEAIKFYKY